mgnify:CR=1 FL=1
MADGWGVDELKAMIGRDFAPFIQAMNIEPLDATDAGMRFRLPENHDLVRGGNILCGQAIASMADTIAVLTLFAHNAEQRLLTTVDMNVQFLRPLFLGDVEAQTFIQSNGKRMANVRVEFRQNKDGELGKLGASAICTFAYIP